MSERKDQRGRQRRRLGALKRLNAILARVQAGRTIRPDGSSYYSPEDVERMLREKITLERRLQGG